METALAATAGGEKLWLCRKHSEEIDLLLVRLAHMRMWPDN